MIRPNLAMDAPPTKLYVGGVSYTIQTDYRVWLDVLENMQELNLNPKTEEAAQDTIDRIHRIEREIFGRTFVDGMTGEVLDAVSVFLRGYENAPMRDSEEHEQTVSLKYDLNYIILAIRNQSGIDLSYRCKHFHWWEFLLEYQTLCGSHYILNLAEIRGYDGKDPDMRRRKAACQLPVEFTAEEKAEYEAFSAMFE